MGLQLSCKGDYSVLEWGLHEYANALVLRGIIVVLMGITLVPNGDYIDPDRGLQFFLIEDYV